VPTDKDKEIKFIASSLRQLNVIVETFERCFVSLAISDDMLRELLAEIPEQLDRIERYIIIGSSSQKPGMKEATAELEQEILRGHIGSLQKQLKQQHANKNLLEEESTQYGSNPPLFITNQIISVSVEIDKIKSELEHFKDLLE